MNQVKAWVIGYDLAVDGLGGEGSAENYARTFYSEEMADSVAADLKVDPDVYNLAIRTVMMEIKNPEHPLYRP